MLLLVSAAPQYCGPLAATNSPSQGRDAAQSALTFGPITVSEDDRKGDHCSTIKVSQFGKIKVHE